jgi:hypothetical protein
MKKIFIPIFVLLFIAASAQDQNTNYSIFNPTKMKKEFFITTNSGILNTPVGIKIGYLSNPGLYLGFRHGIGKVYHSDTDFTTTMTSLVSITGGMNLPLIVKNDFKLVAQVGAGYGQWWSYRWERWTRSGIEAEAGLMAKKKNFLFSVTGNVLNGQNTYATGDICVGIGFVMNNCQN